MAVGQYKKTNDFNDKLKEAVITNVNPQNKTVDIKYTSQAGNYYNLSLPYNAVGLTYGYLFMPLKGDKVFVDTTQGDRPVIAAMLSSNSDFLPYLYPGEMATMCENGSFIHFKNERKRVQSTGKLIAYDATAGPNGEQDLEYEPGGVVLRARSKKDRNGNYPRWDSHSYLSLFDNGDVDIQSMYQNNPKALLHMNGLSGYTFWGSGDNKVQEFIEMDPVQKQMTLFSDGDELHHSLGNQKTTNYINNILNVGGIMQLKTGVDISTLGAFNQIVPDSDLRPGDIRISNYNPTLLNPKPTGKLYLTIAGDANITSINGNVNIVPGQLFQLGVDEEAKALFSSVGVGLGAQYTAMVDSIHNTLNKSHLSTFEQNLFVQRLTDQINQTAIYLQAKVPNMSAALALIEAQALAHIGLPSGSSNTRVLS